jgi:hypothetical protein
VKCGKEYQLEPNEELSNFQCECGGALFHGSGKTKKTFNQRYEESRDMIDHRLSRKESNKTKNTQKPVKKTQNSTGNISEA